MTENKEQLMAIIESLTNSTISATQFKQLMATLVQVMKKTLDKNKEMSDDMQQLVSDALKAIDEKQKEVKGISDGFDGKLTASEKKLLREIEGIKNKLNVISVRDGIDGRDGRDGKDANEDSILAKLFTKIPTTTGESIVDKINALPTDDDDFKIDASHIKNLPTTTSPEVRVAGNRFLDQLVDVNVTGLSKDAFGRYILSSGGLAGTIADTQIAYGNSSSEITGESVFTYNETTNLLSVYNINIATTSATTGTPTAGVLYQNSSALLHTYGTNNTFFGIGSGNFSITTASATDNTAIGYNTLKSLTTGRQNVAIGSGAMENTTVGTNGHVAIGYNALKGINFDGGSTGELASIAIGKNALLTANSNTRACIAIGGFTLSSITTGQKNTAVGVDAFEFLTTGSNNMAWGEGAGSYANAVTTENNNIIIGYRIGIPETGVDSQLTIGNLIYAKGGFGTNTSIGLGGVGIGIFGNATYRLRTASTTNTSGSYAFSAVNSSASDLFTVRGDGLVSASTRFVVGASTMSASAILQADSTTQGFLPPRMTEAQKNAISSPAVGLVIYQTDATEGLYVNSSGGWLQL